MSVERYIRAYNKGTGTLMFEIKLPLDSLTFLSTVPFLVNEDDPLLYYCYELTGEQTDFIHQHFFLKHVADTDYLDYVLDCDNVIQSEIKTKEDLYAYIKQDCVDFINSLVGDSDSSFGLPTRYIQDLSAMQDLCYKIYQLGVSDEHTTNTR